MEDGAPQAVDGTFSCSRPRAVVRVDRLTAGYETLGNLPENGLRAGTIAGALADIAPNDSPIGVDDEDGGCSESVTEDIVDVESLSNLVFRIAEQRVWRADDFLYALIDCRNGSDGKGHDLRAGVLEGRVLFAQLNQLRSIRPSPTPLEKDQNDRPFLQLIFEREGAPANPV